MGFNGFFLYFVMGFNGIQYGLDVSLKCFFFYFMGFIWDLV